MSLLVLTIGNSDVQFDRQQLPPSNGQQPGLCKDGSGEHFLCPDRSTIRLVANRHYRDRLLLKESRTDGEVLLKNLDAVLPFLHFPLVEPIVTFLEAATVKIEKVVFVYTDQQDEKFRFTDTVYTKEIIRRWLTKLLPQAGFDEIGIDKVTDIDHLYPRLRDKVRSWRQLLPEDTQVYLADQGGVDHINQSIRLQLLQAFKSRVHILQKAEGAEARELRFPKLFLKDLARQNIIKHVSDYDFDKIDDTLQPESWVVKLCKYAEQRLSLRHSKLPDDIEDLSAALQQVQIALTLPHWNFNMMNEVEQNKIKLQDLYIAAKIQFRNERHAEFLWRLFTISENMYANAFDQFIGEYSIKKYYNKETEESSAGGQTVSQVNTEWEACLNSVDEELMPELKTKKIWVNNPNRKAYEAIYRLLHQKGKIVSPLQPAEMKVLAQKMIASLTSIRNDLAHNLGTVTREVLIKKLNQKNQNFFDLMDKWFGIGGMGDFDNIRIQILNHYD